MRLIETSNKTDKCDVPEILETYFILVYFLPTGNKCEGLTVHRREKNHNFAIETKGKTENVK